AMLVYHLGVDRLVSGFRSYWSYCSYCENIAPSESPLSSALESLGAEVDPTQWEGMDGATRQILGNLLLDVAAAHEWVERSFRNVPYSVREAVASVHDLEETQSDGQVYYPQFDDLMKDWDLHSFMTGTQIAANAADRAGRALLAIPITEREWSGEDLVWETPIGLVVIGRMCDPENATVKGKGQTWIATSGLLQMDLVGCDSYWDQAASGSPSQPISLAIDLGGDDTWGSDEGHSNADRSTPSPGFGAGLGGVGVLWDGGGDDHYQMDEQGQGFGQAGAGILFDLAGDDAYSANHQAQGSAWFGIGMVVDRRGNDTYSGITTSQASGNAFGVGVLVDGAGNDHYRLEPWSAKAGLAGDYHSGDHILGNNGQGAGFGRRGDLTDGHSWAGGLGFLADLEGDDRYFAGNWAQGVGYWYGTGLIYDALGNDTYSSVYFSTASGAHYAIGAMVDYGGNDNYLMWGSHTDEAQFGGGAGLSFGWDYVATLLLNVGGDDAYSAELISIGCAHIRSVSIFADIGGDDTYRFPQSGCGLGGTDQREEHANPDLYYVYSDNVGIFVDIGGEDPYLDLFDVGTGETRPSTIWKNGARWLAVKDPAQRSRLRIHAVGIDSLKGRFWGYRPTKGE
nr:hypothetical protein [bacterium]